MKVITSFVLVVLFVLTGVSRASEHVETDRPAPARRIFDKITSLQMKEILSREGYKGIEIDGDDDLIIRMDEQPVLIIVRGSSYTNIQFRFSVRTTATLEMVNEWNKVKKYTKAYLSTEGNPILEMDLDLAGGVTEARIKDGIKTFALSLPLFLKELE